MKVTDCINHIYKSPLFVTLFQYRERSVSLSVVSYFHSTVSSIFFFAATVNLHLKTEISWKNGALPVDEYINCLNRKYCFIEKISLPV